jgi:hypothetical protein
VSTGDSYPIVVAIVVSSRRAAARIKFAGQLDDDVQHGSITLLRLDLESVESSKMTMKD